MAEEGFGTRVVISATPPATVGAEEVESLLDALTEPHRQPLGTG